MEMGEFRPFTYHLKYNLSIFKCGHMLYFINRMEGKSNNREILFFLLSLLLGDRFITLPNSILVTIRILFLYSFLLMCIISYVLIPLFTKPRQWVLPGGRLCIAPGVGNKGLHFSVENLKTVMKLTKSQSACDYYHVLTILGSAVTN